MSHEDLFNSVIYVARGTRTPRTAAYRCHVPNRKILEVAIKLESIQEKCDAPLVESYNQQHVSRWIRYHFRLPLVQRRLYTDWEINESCEIRILVKSRYYDLLE